LSAIGSLLSSEISPLALLVSTVALVTIIALFRAPRHDAHRVYTSFAVAFGIHRRRPEADDILETGTETPNDASTDATMPEQDASANEEPA